MKEPTITLTQEQIDFYHREGYLALDAITTPEEIAFMLDIYDRLFEQKAGREEGNQFDLAGTDEDGKEQSLPQIIMPSKYAPELNDTLYHANALAIARQLLGEEAEFQGEHAIRKPGTQGAATPWHQDEAYWDEDQDYNALSIWMPLQDTSVDMGCMQFIPRSHKQEVQPHHSINNDPRVHGLEIDEVDASQAVACPLPAGGCTIHGSRTYHYTSPNQTGKTRRAYIKIFGVPPRKRTEPRDFYWMKEKATKRQERISAAGKA